MTQLVHPCAGEIVSRSPTDYPEPLPSKYYHQHCTWILDALIDRQLNFEISTAQAHSCDAWNVSLHDYALRARIYEDVDAAGVRHHTFCPADGRLSYRTPWTSTRVVVR